MASLLGLQLDDVPDFLANDDRGQFWPDVWKFCRTLGLCYFETNTLTEYRFNHLAYGSSSRGCNHAVVWCDGKMVWDPHPSREGLVSVKRYALLVPYSLHDHVSSVRARG